MVVITEFYGCEKLLHTADGLFPAHSSSSLGLGVCEGRGGIHLRPPCQAGRRLKWCWRPLEERRLVL